MVVKRVYRADGMPAYLTVWIRGVGGILELNRLVYPRAPEFDRLWDKGIEAEAEVLDIPTDTG